MVRLFGEPIGRLSTSDTVEAEDSLQGGLTTATCSRQSGKLDSRAGVKSLRF